MIQYPISRKDLETLIEAECAGWLTAAAKRTAEFRTKGRYEEKSTIWSQVKPIYMRLQGGSKCVYCERKLEAIELGKAEQDVEHFRPKRSVKAWPAPKHLVNQGIPFTAVPTPGLGYFLLPYHPFNYAAACKPCNSALKRDYFPIAGTYQLDGENPGQLIVELPYLIYPIGDFDAPPETLIEFYGLTPRPVSRSGHDRNRALVTIEFFKLSDETVRKNLFHERAMLIIALFPQLKKMSEPASAGDAERATALIDACMRPSMAHSNCCRSFKRLYDRDVSEAYAVYQAAHKFVLSMS